MSSNVNLSLVFCIPVLLTIALAVIGYMVNKDNKCMAPNLVLWIMVAVFILGPGIVSVILAMRMKNARDEYLNTVVVHGNKQD
jgi:hypothetical protein